MRYEVNTAKASDIYQHLVACDDHFKPRLSERVDLKAYAEKIADKAVTFEAWNEWQLAGVIAAYFNTETRTAFITNVSTDPAFVGKGVASQLMRACIDHAKKNGFEQIRLEVMAHNMPAIALYHKFGFADSNVHAGTLNMTYTITEDNINAYE